MQRTAVWIGKNSTALIQSATFSKCRLELFGEENCDIKIINSDFQDARLVAVFIGRNTTAVIENTTFSKCQGGVIIGSNCNAKLSGSEFNNTDKPIWVAKNGTVLI
jgi:hypothetical protein